MNNNYRMKGPLSGCEFMVVHWTKYNQIEVVKNLKTLPVYNTVKGKDQINQFAEFVAGTIDLHIDLQNQRKVKQKIKDEDLKAPPTKPVKEIMTLTSEWNRLITQPNKRIVVSKRMENGIATDGIITMDNKSCVEYNHNKFDDNHLNIKIFILSAQLTLIFRFLSDELFVEMTGCYQCNKFNTLGINDLYFCLENTYNMLKHSIHFGCPTTRESYTYQAFTFFRYMLIVNEIDCDCLENLSVTSDAKMNDSTVVIPKWMAYISDYEKYHIKVGDDDVALTVDIDKEEWLKQVLLRVLGKYGLMRL